MGIEKEKKESIEEVCRSLIYHGRHFSPKRDAIVIQKSIDRITQLFSFEGLKKGDIVKFREPVNKDEAEERMILLEDPDGGRVSVEGICDLPIKPTKVVKIDEIEMVNVWFIARELSGP